MQSTSPTSHIGSDAFQKSTFVMFGLGRIGEQLGQRTVHGRAASSRLTDPDCLCVTSGGLLRVPTVQHVMGHVYAGGWGVTTIGTQLDLEDTS